MEIVLKLRNNWNTFLKRNYLLKSQRKEYVTEEANPPPLTRKKNTEDYNTNKGEQHTNMTCIKEYFLIKMNFQNYNLSDTKVSSNI